MTVTDQAIRPSGLASYVYTPYAWLTFVVCLSGALLSATVLPGLDRRRRWVSSFARGFFSIAGIRVEIRGDVHLPNGNSIVVANHASYLDGVILQAFLPPQFSYVIKSEMRKVPLAGFMLRRIGSRFVERFAPSASARDARNLMRAAHRGEALAFFPEGTFRLEPGLGRFRPGAFVTAVRSSVPLVPVAIHGSRHILPSGTMLAKRGRLVIDILPPIRPEDPGFDDHRELAAEARRRILGVLDEPDLTVRDRD
jgi:1-acyl-sn-glycerol-3-phosphate acyltransferase